MVCSFNVTVERVIEFISTKSNWIVVEEQHDAYSTIISIFRRDKTGVLTARRKLVHDLVYKQRKLPTCFDHGPRPIYLTTFFSSV